VWAFGIVLAWKLRKFIYRPKHVTVLDIQNIFLNVVVLTDTCYVYYIIIAQRDITYKLRD
jgi:hypothetical protein